MGIGFVIIIHLIVIFVLSFIVAIIGAITTYFLSKKNKRKRKTILALILPFIGLYTLYFSCLNLIAEMLLYGGAYFGFIAIAALKSFSASAYFPCSK